jgi:hypothetical protein
MQNITGDKKQYGQPKPDLDQSPAIFFECLKRQKCHYCKGKQRDAEANHLFDHEIILRIKRRTGQCVEKVCPLWPNRVHHDQSEQHQKPHEKHDLIVRTMSPLRLLLA